MSPTEVAASRILAVAVSLIACTSCGASSGGATNFKEPRFNYAVVAPETIPSLISLPFISWQRSVIEFSDAESIRSLGVAWSEAPRTKFVVAHFGDSHLQNGYQVDVIRQRLSQVAGDGGLGMIFPYSAARSYSPDDFKSTSYGTWRWASSMQLSPRLPLGASGYTALTSDAAVMTQFDFKSRIGKSGVKVRLFYNDLVEPYKISAAADGEYVSSKAISLDSYGTETADYFFRGSPQSLRFVFERDANKIGMFSIFGLDIENAGPGGLVYHNLGVGGATYAAILNQQLFDSQLPLLKPNLVILDYGTNDVIYRNEVAPDFVASVRHTIDKVRATVPDTAILIVSPQDASYKGRNVTALSEMSQDLRAVAQSSGCFYYDWYSIAGGAGSMQQWFASGLASKDNVHLNQRGYRIKGALFAEALLRLFEGKAYDTQLN